MQIANAAVQMQFNKHTGVSGSAASIYSNLASDTLAIVEVNLHPGWARLFTFLDSEPVAYRLVAAQGQYNRRQDT